MMSGSERCAQSGGNIGANSIFAMEIHRTQVWKAQAKAFALRCICAALTTTTTMLITTTVINQVLLQYGETFSTRCTLYKYVACCVVEISAHFSATCTHPGVRVGSKLVQRCGN